MLSWVKTIKAQVSFRVVLCPQHPSELMNTIIMHRLKCMALNKQRLYHRVLNVSRLF